MKSTHQILQYLDKLGFLWNDKDLRIVVKRVAELLMELEVNALIDAEHYERNQKRVAYRNGYRKRTWRTAIGNIHLNIPKLRRGTYTPNFLTSETADIIFQSLQQALIFGTTQSDVYDMLTMLGFTDFSPPMISQVQALICDLSESIHQQPIEPDYPCLWLDVVDFTVESDGRNQHKQLGFALGIRADGSHDLLGFSVTPGVNHADFWRGFLRDLTARGLDNVRLVVSDAYRGVKSAIYEELVDAEWQYSRVHALRDVLRYVPDHEHASITAAISTVFVRSDYQSASTQLTHVIDSLATTQMQSAYFLNAVRDNLLAYTVFPSEEWVIFETINSLLRIKQLLLGMDAMNSGFINAVSYQTVIGELDSDISHRLNIPMPMMTME